MSFESKFVFMVHFSEHFVFYYSLFVFLPFEAYEFIIQIISFILCTRFHLQWLCIFSVLFVFDEVWQIAYQLSYSVMYTCALNYISKCASLATIIYSSFDLKVLPSVFYKITLKLNVFPPLWNILRILLGRVQNARFLVANSCIWLQPYQDEFIIINVLWFPNPVHTVNMFPQSNIILSRL